MGAIEHERSQSRDKLATFSEHWQPRTVGQFNGHDLMVVKVKGEFVWHKHDETDNGGAGPSSWRRGDAKRYIA